MNASARSADRLLTPTVVNAEMVSIAITPARSTDGSKRVNAMNQAIRAIDHAQRDHGRSRRSSGPAAATRKARFCPDTAVRWLSPASRNAWTIAGGSRPSSPMTRPVNSAASSAGIADSAASRKARRTRVLARSSGAGSPTSPT